MGVRVTAKDRIVHIPLAGFFQNCLDFGYIQHLVHSPLLAVCGVALAEKYHVEIPIIQQVNAVLFEDKPAREAVNDLMLRDKKIENPLLPWG